VDNDLSSYTLPSITSEEVTFFSNYLRDLSGIMLGSGKGYLLESRFTLIMEELECNSFSELYFLSRNNSNKVLEKRLVDTITTHETSFFRDKSPFELLQKKIIPDFIHSHRKQNRMVDDVPMPLSIWSAACSTGQELYSIAIILKELLGKMDKYSIKLLGSDISEKTIQKAACGSYNDFEINRGLSRERIQRFFLKQKDSWTVNNEIRKTTRFQKVNLMKPFHYLGKFDIIFCRNVALYFCQADRIKFFKAIVQNMHHSSYLFIGSSESLNELSDIFTCTQIMGASYYQLRP
jgi:chemotaxis protein methyltransferase CheR